METLLRLSEVHKRYSPGDYVLRGISISVYKGEALALMGSNGCGKTTLMRILAELVAPTEGRVEYPAGGKPKIGYVPERFPQSIRFSVSEYLLGMGLIAGMRRDILERRVDELLDCFGLGGSRDAIVSKLSKGMRQKVAIMQAILRETDLLILDEPLSGLDAKTQGDLADRLKSLKATGLTMILTSHELPLLAEVADRAVILRDGAVCFDGRIEQLALRRIVIRVMGADPDLIGATAGAYGICPRHDESGYWEFKAEPSCGDAVLLRLLEGGANVLSVESERSRQDDLAGLLEGGGRSDA